MSQGQMQPIQMMGMINGQIQQPGQIQNQSQGGNYSNTKPKPQPAKNIYIEFYFDDVVFGVQGNSNMSIKKLIKNFRVKLCNDKIQIEKYLAYPGKIELDPNSEETLASKNITEKIKIRAIQKYNK